MEKAKPTQPRNIRRLLSTTKKSVLTGMIKRWKSHILALSVQVHNFTMSFCQVSHCVC